MDEDSFDPRSWLKKPLEDKKDKGDPAPREPSKEADELPEMWRSLDGDRPAKPAPAPQAPDSQADDSLPEMWRAAAGPSEKEDALPEMWRSMDGKKSGGPPEDGDDRSPSSAGARTGTAALAAALVLSAGAAAAWTTQVKIEEPDSVQLAAAGNGGVGAGLIERSMTLANSYEIVAAMVAFGVSEQEALAASSAAGDALAREGEIKAIMDLRELEEGFSVERINVSYIDGSGAVIARNADGTFSGQAIAAELIKEVRVLRGELDTDSFYSAAIANGIPSELIPDFINAFSYDFNLAAEISPGDTFEVAFEQSVNADGIAVDQPKLLYARLATPEKSAELYQFQVPGEEQGWWNANGASIKRGLMRTPIDGARITSKFGPRFHPVLKYNRLHGGTDFAAPVGTPIYAARDGTVVSASPSSCAGNMVIIDHDNGWQTRYFHLSRYADGLHAGKRVTQGETIGDVGNTGTCTTGPHLHYEVHIDGEKVDPLGVKTDDGERKRIEGADLQRFMRDRDRVDIARARQGY